MNSNNKSMLYQRSASLQLHFGLSGLSSLPMREGFFPEDLPEDWRLSYYSNEFQLLLISLSDINAYPSSSIEEIIEQLEQFTDELEEDFLLLLDVSPLLETSQDALKQMQKKEKMNTYFINVNKMSTIERIPCSEYGQYVFLDDFEVTVNESVEKQEMGLLCLVKHQQEGEQKIEAKALKTLIEQVQAYAFSKNYGFVNVIFSSSQYALENCRNAILLESMM